MELLSGEPRRLLVTGGAGFIGSHLVDRLVAAGHRVTVLDDLSSGLRDNLDARADLVVGSATDRDLVARLVASVDGCYHLAAIASVQRCSEAWLESHRVNQGSLILLLEAAARRAGGVVPVVYASSAAVYGDPSILPIAEDHATRPLSTYGADKLACELHARAAGRLGGVPTFGLRPFNVYGPRQSADSPYSGVISRFMDRIRRAQAMLVFGDGAQTRDFIHVDDVVERFLAAARHVSPDAPVCNVATGVETSILELARLIGELVGTAPEIALQPARAGDIRRSVADLSRARALLACPAPIKLRDGLKSLA